MSTLPDVRVGDPIRHEALTVFPLFSPPEGGVDYLLSDEAIRAGSVTVEEVERGRLGAGPPGDQPGGLPCPVPRRRGAAGGQAEPGAEHLGPGRRPEQDAHPGQLRRAGPLAIPEQAFRLGRLPLVLEAAAHPQGVGRTSR